MACPPRPETGTGSGGATSLGHSVVASLFRNSSSGPHSLKARTGPGSNGTMGLEYFIYCTPRSRNNYLRLFASQFMARYLLMPKTFCDVVIHQTNRLHEGITDCRTDKLESSLLEIFTHQN